MKTLKTFLKERGALTKFKVEKRASILKNKLRNKLSTGDKEWLESYLPRTDPGALSAAFLWAASIQGHEYWFDLNEDWEQENAEQAKYIDLLIGY